MVNKLHTSLQESILTLLVMNNKEGRIAAGLITPAHFEEPYSYIARRALDYHKKYGRAPGAEHIDDIVLDNPKSKLHKIHQTIVIGLINQTDGLNAKYVLSKISRFIREQSLKAAVLESAERFGQDSEGLVDDVEAILHGALREQITSIDVGTRLSDVEKSLEFLLEPAEHFPVGIPALDKLKIGPTRKEMLVLIAAKGGGKSWFCAHCSKMAMLSGKKVLYISLEMDEAKVVQRLMQSFWAVAKRPGKFKTRTFEMDAINRLVRFKEGTVRPRISLQNAKVAKFLRGRIKRWGSRLDNIIVKQFPSGSLTVPRLRSYLDSLELTQKFVPDLLIIDYPDLMWADAENLRTSLGRTFVELRGLLVERNMAGIMPTQTNREGWKTGKVRGHHVAEDASKLFTADNVLIYQQTEPEKALELARIFVEKARNEEDKFEVLISQHYGTGQFALSSVRMPRNYWDVLTGVNKEKSEEGEDG